MFQYFIPSADRRADGSYKLKFGDLLEVLRRGQAENMGQILRLGRIELQYLVPLVSTDVAFQSSVRAGTPGVDEVRDRLDSECRVRGVVERT